jgi:hypothetical protein
MGSTDHAGDPLREVVQIVEVVKQKCMGQANYAVLCLPVQEFLLNLEPGKPLWD